MIKENWLRDLYEKQRLLDSYIEENSGIKPDVEYKFCAFMVELGEFLNEVRAFKYWSHKEMDKRKAYEEFIDGIHFILSIGNLLGFDVKSRETEKRIQDIKYVLLNPNNQESKYYFTTQANKLFLASQFLTGLYEDYVDFFKMYMKLGYMIGMTLEEMIQEYEKKHEINYKRQKEGY